MDSLVLLEWTSTNGSAYGIDMHRIPTIHIPFLTNHLMYYAWDSRIHPVGHGDEVVNSIAWKAECVGTHIRW